MTRHQIDARLEPKANGSVDIHCGGVSGPDEAMLAVVRGSLSPKN